MLDCDNCNLPIETVRLADVDPSLCEPCRELQSGQNQLFVTPLDEDDLELVFAWRSNPSVYRHFRQQKAPLDWDKHLSWFESRNNTRQDYVIHFRGRRVGVASLTDSDEVSIYLGELSARGHGVATEALNWLCDRFEARTPLHALIHEKNEPSKKLFERCGFEARDMEDGWVRYVYEP